MIPLLEFACRGSVGYARRARLLCPRGGWRTSSERTSELSAVIVPHCTRFPVTVACGQCIEVASVLLNDLSQATRVSSSVRHELAVLARRKKARVVQWSSERPSDWRPSQVREPSTDMPYTEVGAWHLIADLLDRGHPLEEIVLCKPPGKRAYVMHVELEPGQPRLYIKLQLGNGKVIGRSFHYSFHCSYRWNSSPLDRGGEG